MYKNNRKSLINEGRKITDGKFIYGGFPRILKEDEELGNGEIDKHPEFPTIPSTNPTVPMPPGNPAYWYKQPSTPFGRDGENPGIPPGPNDPRWNKWYEEWQRKNPKPGPGSTPQQREDYQKLLKEYQKWRDQYFKWWQQNFGHN